MTTNTKYQFDGLDDVPTHGETPDQFKVRAMHAKMQQKKFIEADENIITYLVPGGLGNSEYFYYDGLMVCKPGRYEEIMKKNGKQLDEIVHGDNFKFEGR